MTNTHEKPLLRFKALNEIYSIATDSSVDELITILRDEYKQPVFSDQMQNGLLLDASGIFKHHQLGQQEHAGNFVSNNEISSIFTSRFGESPTSAELDLLKSLLARQTLKENSSQDNVAYGTRRNQLTALRSKAGLSRQGDLMMIMSVILVNYIHSKAGETQNLQSKLRDYMQKYYSPDFRIHVPKLESGRHLLVADLGPLDGKPCLMMHSGFFPIFPLPHDIDCLHKLGARVFAPIRPGYFYSPARSEVPLEDLRMFVDDVANFIKVFNLTGAPVISQTYGAISALLLAEKLQSEKLRIVLSSPQYCPETLHSKINIYQKGWAVICRRFPKFVEPTIKLLTQRLNSMDRFIAGYQKTYASSPPDLKLVDNNNLRPFFLELLHLLVLGNFVGMKNDLITIMEDWPKRLAGLQHDIHVIYGKHDPFANQDGIATELANTGVSIETIEDFGQNSALFNPEILFDRAFR